MICRGVGLRVRPREPPPGGVQGLVACRATHLGCRLRCIEDAVEVGVDDVGPLLLLHAHHQRVARDPSIVHEHAHRIVVGVRSRLEERLDALTRGHVRLDGHAVAAELLDLRNHLLRRTCRGRVVHHHAAALSTQLERNRTPKPTAAASHDAHRTVRRHAEGRHGLLRRAHGGHGWRHDQAVGGAKESEHVTRRLVGGADGIDARSARRKGV